jgi:hypothetical protein
MEHKDSTMSGLDRLDKFIRRKQIVLETQKVAANPVLAGNSRKEGLEHYRCRLLRPGRQLNVFLSVAAADDPPTLFDVLFMLALDASGCDMMAGFEKYRDKWHGIFGESGRKPGEIEFFWEELESRCRQTEELRDFLGPSAYERLLSLFGLDEGQDLNPAEGTSMVPSTSG